jgi:hypothetical protein
MRFSENSIVACYKYIKKYELNIPASSLTACNCHYVDLRSPFFCAEFGEALSAYYPDTRRGECFIQPFKAKNKVVFTLTG